MTREQLIGEMLALPQSERLELAQDLCKSMGHEAVERAVEGLSPAELASFSDWFAAFDAEVWDRQFEEDVAAGRLDFLAEEVQSAFSVWCPLSGTRNATRNRHALGVNRVARGI